MEKLARAAELKRKRQEQAAQQREARKAAEEAERVATEKARATKRYGRYGVPKPQISLIDAPLPESAGTVKSHVVESPTKPANQPASIEDKAEKEPLKNLEGHFTTNKSPQKLLFSEPMVVDAPEESPAKIRRSLAREDVVMVDEETRMSADFRGSRLQTPAKQSAQPADVMVEDSQGSIGTEGGKSRSSKAPKMEVFQDLKSAAYSADQLAEYSWNGQGPFMIQEQVTQYLGIKSFKRKYPNMTRRAVDIQERDYLKERGQVTEGQCDLGLTAVAAQDILDIMYADFQDKYEYYCNAQREKQARELANKQKALNQFTLKPGFDKLDILEQAVQSAAAWNSQFNKARREQRRAHMDLQNWSIHYPKSKMKVLPAPKIGHYPIALVPGQFTDYYRDYTPTELNNLPLNTMCYDEIKVSRPPAQSEESSNGSDSDSESSSGSSSSGSSCDDANCKECDKKVKKTKELRETDSDDVVFVENDASSSDSVVLVSVTSAPVTA
uniref:PHD finger protein 10 n=2 Tax=Dendroctonus ponderosae TaxID=77166 RepID=A0AAR5Q1X1_DENPD